MHSQACSHMQSTPLVRTRPQQTLLYSTLVYTKTCTRRAVRRTGCEPTSSASPTVPSCYMICELPLQAAQECGVTQDVKETHLWPHWQGRFIEAKNGSAVHQESFRWNALGQAVGVCHDLLHDSFTQTPDRQDMRVGPGAQGETVPCAGCRDGGGAEEPALQCLECLRGGSQGKDALYCGPACFREHWQQAHNPARQQTQRCVPLSRPSRQVMWQECCGARRTPFRLLHLPDGQIDCD